jgi:hypothetical protein
MIENTTVVPVASFHNSIAGHAYANALIARGINAAVVGDHTSEFRVGGTGDVSVLVPGSQLEQARQLLDQIKSDSIALQCDEEDPIESSTKPWKKLLAWSILVINLIGLFGYLIVVVLTQ